MLSFKLDRSNRLCRVSGRSRSMGLQGGNSLLIIFILFFTCICTPTTSSQLMSSRHDEQAPCKTVNCGMGTCQETLGLPPGYVCNCNSGWTKLPLLWPSCIIPNCTINYQCGGEPPLPPPPPPPLIPPPIDVSLPCLLVWCGDGVCVASGTSHECQCNQGSVNLGGLQTLPCFQKCNLGADCTNVELGTPAAPPPPPPLKSSASPGNGNSSPPSPSAPPRNGLANAPNCSKSYRALSWTILALIVLVWI
ncbi:uncharacterized protein LOC115678356 isoform X1 [Syzygium oleosum]|uniref:uncharacterized protein LOC115678356 isoform X1 n=1 Tax=Syzygium oleosum TaxID=219896 RepID=UPI0011D1F79C|nr:uncharacterized protein LOC115678356 isoform X1 [Syzygium oleosum]